MTHPPNCTKDSHELWRQCMREWVMGEQFTPVEAAVFFTGYALITAFGLLGNGLVMYVVISKRAMRSTRNVFITNLALSNFLLAVMWIPFLWMPTFEREFKHGVFLCKLAQSFSGINIYCSTLTISVIAIDRYIVVACSRFGADRMKVCQAIVISIGIWIVALGLSFPYLLFYNIHEVILPQNITMEMAGFPETHLLNKCTFQPVCFFSDVESNQCVTTYEFIVNILMAVFLYVLPLLVLFTFNFLLTKFLKTTERQSTALRGRQLTTEMDNCNPTVNNGNKNKKVRGRRNRTTALLFAMAVAYAVLWLPFTILSLYIHLGPQEQRGERHVSLADESCKMVSFLSVCVNPILYGYLNTNFNREFKAIFRKAFPFLKFGPPKNSRDALKTQMSGFSLLTKDSDSDRTPKTANHNNQKICLQKLNSENVMKADDDDFHETLATR